MSANEPRDLDAAMNQPNFLEEIVAQRRLQVAIDRAVCNRSALRREVGLARCARLPHRLRNALQQRSGVHIIGEFKRASPSRGMIRRDAKLDKMIGLYEKAGVSAVSVLTEPNFFHGGLADLQKARALTELPILCKDFIVDEYQVEEAAAAGADAILLIVAALADFELLRLRTLAEGLGLDTLVEVHTAEEMRRARDSGANLIGVNNRDLRSLAISLETSIELSAIAPAGAILISESGITARADIDRLSGCGYRGFLIGESLMRATDPVKLIHCLRDTIGESRRV